MAEKSNIHTAKLAVMEEVGYVKKSRTQGLNYSFASESEFIARLRPAMVQHGITLSPIQVEVIDRSNYTTARGAVMQRILIRSTYRLTHAESGTHEDVVVLGEAADSGDKCANKAMTGAFKYALRQPFVIETGDDPDRYPSEEQEEAGEVGGAAVKLANLLAAKLMASSTAEEVERLAKECAESKKKGLLGENVDWLRDKFAEARKRVSGKEAS